jgi:hypothetical protein
MSDNSVENAAPARASIRSFGRLTRPAALTTRNFWPMRAESFGGRARGEWSGMAGGGISMRERAAGLPEFTSSPRPPGLLRPSPTTALLFLAAVFADFDAAGGALVAEGDLAAADGHFV